jgi:spermidine synthase
MPPMPSPAIWLEIDSPFRSAPGTLLLADPPVSNARKLRSMLLEQRYPKPFVIDDGEYLCLHFNMRLIQSQMEITAPNALVSRYARKMMAFLLFNPRPRRMALIGMGGGSLVKYCHQHLPWCHLTAIESDPHVLAFRDVFKVPRDGPNLETLQTDGARWLANAERGLDAVLVDAFDENGLAPALADREFFVTCFNKLSRKGQLVINLAGEKRQFKRLLDTVNDVFDGRMILLPVHGDGNAILFAFRETGFEPDWRKLHREAVALQEEFDLDFPDYARKLERATD